MEKDGYILPVGYKLKSDSRTYTIEKKLGQGGYGITYLAYFEKEVKVNVQGNLGDGFDEYTTQLIRVVCKEFYIKELSSREENTATVTFGSSTAQRQLIESFKQKMRKEAKFLSQLVHPNIARVSEVFEANNTVYIIMQYIRGESLLEKIRRLKHLSVQDAVRYITQICDAINEVHRNRILHLDIKPSNILFDLNDNVKLIDFGVSKQYNEKHEETSHSLLGQSAGFAPMEQYQQGGLTTFCPPTDIYALGAT
ncbi:MAG: serine/threonine protein kinase, partial [Tannerella sp.]|nr:serine/threonine protein kinase [Tannerella sp.]